MAKEHVDPKSAGMGAELLSSVDLVVKSHDAVREVLLSLEAAAAASGNPTDLLDDVRAKAQLARRSLETLAADLGTLRSSLASEQGAASAPPVNGAAAQHVHVHLHLEVSSPNAQLRVRE